MTTRTLLIATHNNNKFNEIKEILSPYFNQITSLKEIGYFEEIEENGSTFLENALIKAKHIAKIKKTLTIADDSGLCVESLNNQPGIYSARFAGQPTNDKNNNEKLLELLKDKPNRKAYFTSVVVLYDPHRDEYIKGVGKINGEILKSYRGNNGFGYDPLFYIKSINKTFAECNEEEKNKISHRARAIQNLLPKLEKFLI